MVSITTNKVISSNNIIHQRYPWQHLHRPSKLREPDIISIALLQTTPESVWQYAISWRPQKEYCIRALLVKEVLYSSQAEFLLLSRENFKENRIFNFFVQIFQWEILNFFHWKTIILAKYCWKLKSMKSRDLANLFLHFFFFGSSVLSSFLSKDLIYFRKIDIFCEKCCLNKNLFSCREKSFTGTFFTSLAKKSWLEVILGNDTRLTISMAGYFLTDGN